MGGGLECRIKYYGPLSVFLRNRIAKAVQLADPFQGREGHGNLALAGGLSRIHLSTGQKSVKCFSLN